jgi:hypothetical protein
MARNELKYFLMLGIRWAGAAWCQEPAVPTPEQQCSPWERSIPQSQGVLCASLDPQGHLPQGLHPLDKDHRCPGGKVDELWIYDDDGAKFFLGCLGIRSGP